MKSSVFRMKVKTLQSLLRSKKLGNRLVKELLKSKKQWKEKFNGFRMKNK